MNEILVFKKSALKLAKKILLTDYNLEETEYILYLIGLVIDILDENDKLDFINPYEMLFAIIFYVCSLTDDLPYTFYDYNTIFILPDMKKPNTTSDIIKSNTLDYKIFLKKQCELLDINILSYILKSDNSEKLNM